MKNGYAVVLWIAALLPCAVASPGIAQQAPEAAQTAAAWTIDQAVTCTVHEAWVLGGKTESGFFAIVKAMAELSAEKRDLVLPDRETTGREFGDFIKKQARTDRDQLLYAIVDHAVRKYGTPPPADAAK
jgi:hypothetical protein